MNTLPVLMKTPMVIATIELRKTQTRRVINKLKGYPGITEFGQSDTNGYDWHFRDKRGRWVDIEHAQLLALCPYGQVGDRLWVRETFSQCLNLGFDKNGNPPENLFSYSYRADGGALIGERWKPPIHMPRAASRILLEITDIRVERLQDISEADALAEGIISEDVIVGAHCAGGRHTEKWATRYFYDGGDEEGYECAVDAFAALWEMINGADSWEANSWVWVVSFRVVQGGDL